MIFLLKSKVVVSCMPRKISFGMKIEYVAVKMKTNLSSMLKV